jgi:ATP-dependent Lon protease
MTDQKSPAELKVLTIPDILPVMPLFNVVVFPNMVFPIEVFGEQSISLVDEAMAGDRIIGLVTSKKSPLEVKNQREDFHEIGTASVILRMAKTGDNGASLLVQGISRFKVNEFVEGRSYPRAKVEVIEDVVEKDIEVEALMANLTGLFEKMVKLSPVLPQEFGAMAKSITSPGILADVIASIMNAAAEEKQKILEILGVKERLKEVTLRISHQLEILELGNKIQSQVKEDIEKSQRE